MSNLKAVFISDIHLAPGEDWSHCIWKYTPNEELPGLLEQWKNMVNDELKPDVVFELGDRIIDVDRALLVLELVDAGDGKGFTQYRIARKYATVFNIMYDLSIYGVEVLSIDGHKINLLVKSGMDFFTGTMDLDSTLTKIPFKKAFTIKGADVQIDGKTVTVSMNDYYQQGYTLYNGKLYVPFTRIAKDLPHTIVFVYDYNSTESTRSPIMSETLMFQHPESTKFEIESFSFYNGKMYFSTNCDSPITDGFHYFEF